MAMERTRELVLRFAHDPAPRLLADDAAFVFAELSEERGGTDGREVRGPAAIARALAHFYGEGTGRWSRWPSSAASSAASSA